jgi:hypothetical protein
MMVQRQSGQILHQNLSQKYPTQNKAGRMTKMVECLPSKCETLSSNSKKKRKQKRNALAK